MKTVADLMTRQVLTVDPEASAKEAAHEEIREEERGNLVGVTL